MFPKRVFRPPMSGRLCRRAVFADLGRIASHYYIKYDTVEVINELLQPSMYERDLLAMVSRSSEFEQIKVLGRDSGVRSWRGGLARWFTSQLASCSMNRV